jgi:hypothetical protein
MWSLLSTVWGRSVRVAVFLVMMTTTKRRCRRNNNIRNDDSYTPNMTKLAWIRSYGQLLGTWVAGRIRSESTPVMNRLWRTLFFSLYWRVLVTSGEVVFAGVLDISNHFFPSISWSAKMAVHHAAKESALLFSLLQFANSGKKHGNYLFNVLPL